MAEVAAPEVGETSLRKPKVVEEEGEMATPDVQGVGVKITRARDVYKNYGGFQEKPSIGEVLGWFLYGLCSYFVHTVLIPIVFPLIISQAAMTHDIVAQGYRSFDGLNCSNKEMQLFEDLTLRSIKVHNLNFSPLEWTSISWMAGLILAVPVLGTISIHLDYGQNHQLLAGATTALGALFCLPAGFFKTTSIFPPYIAAIAVANTMGAASHARNLGLMVQGFVGSTIRKKQFPDRRAVMSWLSLYSTAAGCFGSAIISAFTYHMVRQTDSTFTSLWVVSIFSGLKWLVGTIHILSTNRSNSNPNPPSNPIPKTHIISIFQYPHAAGSLTGVFIASFSTMLIFTSAILYLIGQLCFKPLHLLYLWLTYFIFPTLSLPLLHPLQQIIRADAVKMQLLGLLLSTLSAGFGFYYRHSSWHDQHVLLFAAVQSTATGVLHAFGRVLLLDCAPVGKEGTFSAWFSWVRALGTCSGFALASVGSGNINRSFGVAFCTGLVGIVVLIFGNISNFRGAIAAGHVREASERGSPVYGLDISTGGIIDGKENVPMDQTTPPHDQGGRVEV